MTGTSATLDALGIRPGCVLIVENHESLAALPPLEGVAAVHNQGLAAPELAVVGWLAAAEVVYGAIWTRTGSGSSRTCDARCPTRRAC